MTASHEIPLVALVGPTASGKTALSIEVAARLDAEIVSMDSRQVYRGMDIGTAKPTPEEQAGIPHFGLSVVSPDVRFNAGEFSRLARRWIDEIRGRGRIPLLVGGTGFFLRALMNPIFREPELDAERRQQLQRLLEALPDEELYRWLEALDPESAARLKEWGGRQRRLRALELPILSGRPLSWWHRRAPPQEPPLDPIVFVLDVPRAELNRRIDERVDQMVQSGLLDEVKGLLEQGFDETTPGMRAHGYQEVIPYIHGERALEAALDEVRRATRAYARRQLTWFRNQLPEGAVWLDGTRPRVALADEIVREVCEWSERGVG